MTRRPALFILVLLAAACARSEFRPVSASLATDRARHEATGTEYAVASQGSGATAAVAEMFRRGGNIVDAAAAASFAISVERPQSTGLGGGGFMLLHLAGIGETIAVDFREKAPAAATAGMFLDRAGEVAPGRSTEGILAAGVPGLVAGVLEVHSKYGRLSRQEVLAPAIALAENGFPVDPELAIAFAEKRELLARFPSSRAVFLKPDGSALKAGDPLRQADLAKTLRAVAEEGREAFYRGWIARAIVEESRRHRGLITRKDLEQYDVRFRAPVTGSFNGYSLASMPPPSSGGIHLIQILNVLDGDDLRSLGRDSPRAVHLTARAMQLAFADRAAYLGDSDFVPVPVRGLLSPAYARELRAKVDWTKRVPSSDVAAGDPKRHESTETTHFSILDREGNAVAATETVNGWFGSGIVVAGAGFLLNNEMDDFSAKPGASNLYGAVGGAPNSIEPEKRPLSSMSPTIVFEKGRPLLALGSPGGTRIITCTLLTLLNALEYRMPLYEAVASYRYHHQWKPDEIQVEDPSFPTRTARTLEAMGYKIAVKDPPCRVQAVAREGSLLRAVSDPRFEGSARSERTR
jgi:gamma-glutamyltranspeptidase/glutathione hydrolase